MMRLDKEVLFCAKLCSYLQDPSTCCSHVITMMSDAKEFVVDKTHMTLVDGVHSGEDAKALILEHRRKEDHGLHQVTIAFRGSGNVDKELWLLNRMAEPENLYLDGAPGDLGFAVPVHKGLLRMYRSIESKIREVIRRCPPRSRIVMTGYGTGGALARIAALDCAWRNRMDPYHLNNPFRVVTFGTPAFAGRQMRMLLHRAGVTDDVNLAGALDPVARWNSSPRKIRWILPPVETTGWIYWDIIGGSVMKPSVTIPSIKTWGFWTVPNDPKEHDIGRIISHIRSELMFL